MNTVQLKIAPQKHQNTAKQHKSAEKTSAFWRNLRVTHTLAAKKHRKHSSAQSCLKIRQDVFLETTDFKGKIDVMFERFANKLKAPV